MVQRRPSGGLQIKRPDEVSVTKLRKVWIEDRVSADALRF
jgi:hypothetical protein